MGLAVVSPKEKWQPKSSVLDSLTAANAKGFSLKFEVATRGG
jgi:hypothetical protein